MKGSHCKYYEALGRLKSGTSKLVPRGAKITYDAVSLEAGLGKGTIKKSRGVFAKLIAAIDEARMQQATLGLSSTSREDELKNELAKCQKYLDAALSREVSLLREVYLLKKELANLTGVSIIPIRGRALTKK